MKIGREDFEALIKGEKDITPYIKSIRYPAVILYSA